MPRTCHGALTLIFLTDFLIQGLPRFLTEKPPNLCFLPDQNFWTGIPRYHYSKVPLFANSNSDMEKTNNSITFSNFGPRLSPRFKKKWFAMGLPLLNTFPRCISPNYADTSVKHDCELKTVPALRPRVTALCRVASCHARSGARHATPIKFGPPAGPLLPICLSLCLSLAHSTTSFPRSPPPSPSRAREHSSDL